MTWFWFMIFFLQVKMIFPCSKLNKIFSWHSSAVGTSPVRTNIIRMTKVPCDLFRKYHSDEQSEKVSKCLLCRAEIFLRVSWWSLIQILQEGTCWWEKASTGLTYRQVCARKFMWFQPQTSLEGVCPIAKNNRIFDLIKSLKEGKENAVCWLFLKRWINMLMFPGWTFCHEAPLTHLNHLILIRWGWTHCWPH